MSLMSLTYTLDIYLKVYLKLKMYQFEVTDSSRIVPASSLPPPWPLLLSDIMTVTLSSLNDCPLTNLA